jgi:hypothetical protein
MNLAKTYNGVTAIFIDGISATRTCRARYLMGCDDGSWKVRKPARIKMLGGQIYTYLCT